MKSKTLSPQRAKVQEAPKNVAQHNEPQPTASGRWSAVQRVRLPHKPGLPLGSGGGGDGA